MLFADAKKAITDLGGALDDVSTFDALARLVDAVDDLVDAPLARRALKVAGDDFGLEFVRHKLPVLLYGPV